MAHVQNLETIAGTDQTFTLSARDAANAAKDLTGQTLTAYFGRAPKNPDSGNSIFTASGTATVTASGTYTVPVTDSDTENLEGEYAYQVRAVSGSTSIVVTRGSFIVRRTIT